MKPISWLLLFNLALPLPVFAGEAPNYKRLCGEMFLPETGAYGRFNETINVHQGVFPAFAIPSKNSLNSHSQFHWLIRRANKDEGLYHELFKKGIRVRNPGTGGQVGFGVVEQTWSHLYENIVPFSHSLFEMNRAEFTPAEQALVQQIFAVMYMKQDLKFLSEKSKPGFFEQAGPHRLAVTGSSPGSTIYINDSHTQIFNVEASKDSFTSNIPLNQPAIMRSQGGTHDVDKVLNSTKKEAMANILGLLVHEFGHHAGLKDTPERPLDQLAAKFEKLAMNALQEVDLSIINQPWIRVRTLNTSAPSASAPEGKLYLVEVADLYDLTPEIKTRVAAKLGKEVTKIWSYNVRVEGAGNFDHSEFATPVSVIADVVALTSDGNFVTVPTRLVAYIGPSQAMRFNSVRESWWQYSNGQLRKGPEEALLSAEVLIDRAQKGIAVKPNPKLDIASAMFTRQEYAPGEMAEFHMEIPNTGTVDLKTLTAELTADNFVQSGAIKKSTFTLSPTRLQTLGNGTTVASFQWQVPGKVRRALKMKVTRVTAKNNEDTLSFRLATPLAFSVKGGKSEAKLISYGNNGRRVDAPVRAYPQPWLGIMTDPGTAVPIELRFESGTPISLKISGTVSLKGTTHSENSGFVVDLLAKENHPLLESKEIKKEGNQISVRMMIRAPRTYNGLPVEHIMMKSVYLLDEKLDEVFENAVIGIKPQ